MQRKTCGYLPSQRALPLPLAGTHFPSRRGQEAELAGVCLVSPYFCWFHFPFHAIDEAGFRQFQAHVHIAYRNVSYPQTVTHPSITELDVEQLR